MSYTYGDIVYFVGAYYYILAVLQDNHWFWFLPLAGQYGVAPGRIQIESTKALLAYGKPLIYFITRPCKQRRTKIEILKKQQYESSVDNA